MKTIGITTTVPIEVLLCADYKVIDLNNIFITSDNYSEYIEIAEREGFPKSSCAWIKGIYGVCIKNNISEVVGVLEGDCSNTRALTEVLSIKGIKVIPFSYPVSHEYLDLKRSIDSFMNYFGVDLQQVEIMRSKLNEIRKLAREIDRYSYENYKLSGFENHLIQVSLSDFNCDVLGYKAILKSKLEELKNREEKDVTLRLGYIGVPPMTSDLFEFVEGFKAGIVYNEVQREFAFPRADISNDIYEQYLDYTYPYSIEFRLEEIKKQITERRLHGIIHYTQAFCYRAIEDIVIKDKLDIPILKIEGDKLNCLDPRTKLRIEAFLDMLLDKVEVEA